MEHIIYKGHETIPNIDHGFKDKMPRNAISINEQDYFSNNILLDPCSPKNELEQITSGRRNLFEVMKSINH